MPQIQYRSAPQPVPAAWMLSDLTEYRLLCVLCQTEGMKVLTQLWDSPHVLNVREAIITHPACGGKFHVVASVAEETVFEKSPLDCQKCGAKAVPAEEFDYLIEPRMEAHQWVAKSRVEIAELRRKEKSRWEESIRLNAIESERIAGARAREARCIASHHTDERREVPAIAIVPALLAPLAVSAPSGNARYKIFGQSRFRNAVGA